MFVWTRRWCLVLRRQVWLARWQQPTTSATATLSLGQPRPLSKFLTMTVRRFGVWVGAGRQRGRPFSLVPLSLALSSGLFHEFHRLKCKNSRHRRLLRLLVFSH